tara:strand:+ start:669 stop:809 length:141 start_codon:yes stop_codon:yes gene_type:complete
VLGKTTGLELDEMLENQTIDRNIGFPAGRFAIAAALCTADKPDRTS